MSDYEVYRTTTLGSTLQEALDELIQVKYGDGNLYLKLTSN